MIITMLVYYYLFVFQYFKFNSVFVILLISSANIQLFHSPPTIQTNSLSPCAICLAFMVSLSLPNGRLCLGQIDG